jgi:hypothetical protein
MNRIKRVAMLAVGVAAPWVCRGQEPMPLPEELAVTRSVVVVEQDELEVEPGVQYYRPPAGRQVDPSLELEYGVTEALELEAGATYGFLKPRRAPAVDGIGDTEVAARYCVLDSRTHPFAATLGLEAQLPTGNRMKDLGEGRLTLEPNFTVSQRLGRFVIEVNPGWERGVTNGGEEGKDEYEYNVALLYPFRRWCLVLEGNGTTVREQTKYYVTPELVCRPSGRLECFLAVPVGVTHAAGDFGILIGVDFEFENLLHRGTDPD